MLNISKCLLIRNYIEGERKILINKNKKYIKQLFYLNQKLDFFMTQINNLKLYIREH